MQTPKYAPVMDSWKFEGSAFQRLNQEVSHQNQNLMHQENNDRHVICEASPSHESPFSPIHQTRKRFRVSPGFYDPNLSHSGFNNVMASNSGCGMHGVDEYSNSDHDSSSLLVASDGKNMPSLVDPRKISGEVVNPEHISSVSAYSDAGWYSDKGPFEVGATLARSAFSEPTSGDSHWIRPGESVPSNPNFDHVAALNPNFNHVGALSLWGDNVEQDKYSGLLFNHISPRIPEDSNALSSKSFGKPKLNNAQCHLQPYPPAHFGPLEAQMYGRGVGYKIVHNIVSEQRSSKLSQLSLEQLHTFQQQGFCNSRTSTRADSVRHLHNVLVSYLNNKSKLMDARSRLEFFNQLHLINCRGVTCKCAKYRIFFSHFDNCQTSDCNICAPIRQLCHIKKINSVTDSESWRMPKECFSGDYIQEGQPIPKRMKMENALQLDDWSLGAVVDPFIKQGVGGVMDDEESKMKMNKVLLSSMESPTIGVTRNVTADNGRPKSTNMCLRKTDELLGPEQTSEGPLNSATLKKEIPSAIGNLGDSTSELNIVDEQQEAECVNTGKVSSDVTFSCQGFNSDGISVLPEESPMDEGENTNPMSEPEHDRIDAKCDLAKSDLQSGTKLEDLKVSGVSLIDFFTPEQIKEHLGSLNPCTNMGLTGNTSPCTVDENTCQLCAVKKLTFTAPPMYCTYCGDRIKHGLTYYKTLDGMGAEYCFCTLCFKRSRGGNISFRGLSFSKTKLQKTKNADEFVEAWVQCDKCERWQHQICALYNSKRDFGGELYYICPFCRLVEIEAKNHVSIPSAFGARDLPRTKLSDHIEQRLFRSLEKERKQRADALGKSPGEVPGAADLVVRVVLAVDKQLKVKQQFLDILHGETYPTEFPYKSKVLLLFQKVEGVDVCLFAMYLQEFGSDCGHPNKRSVYISYLDSVKYFTPEIKTVDGVALRTFVYYEILIGYLDYCKKRGFTTCYIWACPPLKGEDYILYCHPGNQRTPNPPKLLHWYKKLLRKAKEENVVVEYTNFYDYYFVPSGECNSKITAARLPYFDGDYWSGAIEEMIRIIEKESGGDSERNCFELKKTSNGLKTHTDIHGEKHQLFQIPLNDVATDTEDNDVRLDNDFFDNRNSFLNFSFAIRMSWWIGIVRFALNFMSAMPAIKRKGKVVMFTR
ncbi:hypothetical protein DH2020_037191 [Rehmannia glutinosa]|uniref:histone acetyltransferase n=1 Tax=Rehmannia glutinosa TaxID=99300 RepID=A0ABR0V387_REHGL